MDEVIAASGLGGRERATGSSRERARVAATKALTTAIDRIAAVDKTVGRHLQRTIHTGSILHLPARRTTARSNGSSTDRGRSVARTATRVLLCRDSSPRAMGRSWLDVDQGSLRRASGH